MTPYQPEAVATHRDVKVRGLRYRLHSWGDPEAPIVLLLHGWADTGMSFQLIADRMHPDWRLIAPDWRGFGDSAWSPGGYWFPDYLADLDGILERLEINAPVRLVGHSMGGNVAWLYAGIRPDRVSHVASLDAFGLREGNPDEAPERYRLWLDQWHNAPGFSPYRDRHGVMERIHQLAPGLAEGEVEFIACQWSRHADNGGMELKHDPAHKRVNPILYRRTEARACWRRIGAHALLVLGRRSRFHKLYFEEGGQGDCRSCIPHLEEVVLDCGHMLHLDGAAQLAPVLDFFLKKPPRALTETQS